MHDSKNCSMHYCFDWHFQQLLSFVVVWGRRRSLPFLWPDVCIYSDGSDLCQTLKKQFITFDFRSHEVFLHSLKYSYEWSEDYPSLQLTWNHIFTCREESGQKIILVQLYDQTFLVFWNLAPNKFIANISRLWRKET